MKVDVLELSVFSLGLRVLSTSIFHARASAVACSGVQRLLVTELAGVHWRYQASCWWGDQEDVDSLEWMITVAAFTKRLLKRLQLLIFPQSTICICSSFH